MKCKQLIALIAITAGCLLASCHSDIDLGNIDKQAEVEMGLALPIGNLHLKIGDFIGDGKIDHLYVEDGVFALKIDTPITREYSKFELKSYIPDVNMPLLDVYKELKELPDMGGYKIIPGDDKDHTIPFPLTLKLDGINHPDSIGKQRLDSALIDSASFVSTISVKGGMTLNWNQVERIVLKLGKRVHPLDGTDSMLIYEKGNPDFAQYTDFGQNIDTRLRDFSIVLMKNLHPSTLIEYLTNVVDSVEFTVDFTVNIPSGQSVNVPVNSGFDYHMTVQFLDYKAIWGMFEPSDDMHDENVLDISKSWKDMDFLTRASLPFAEPKVDVNITTKIAGALYIDSAYLFTINREDSTTYATFNADESKYQQFTFKPGEYLPLSSAIGDSTTNMKIHFNNTPEGGRLNNIFKGVPKKLGYRFNVKFDAAKTPQIRVIPDMNIRVHALTTLPLIFDEGMHLDYTDTIRDVNLSQYSIDSLTAKTEIIDTMKTTDVTLFLTAYNTIPMDIRAVFRCIDINGDTIMDPADPSKPMTLFAEDSLTFVAPQYEYIGGNWQRTSEGKTVITAQLSKEKLNLLPKVKNIVYSAVLENKTLQDEYDAKRGFTAKITEDSGLTLKIGLTAQADVVLNLNK